MTEFSHLDKSGNVRMVDISEKKVTKRTAIATGFIEMQPATVKKIVSDKVPKGNVLTTAKIAGVQAAKKTFELVPLCHPLNLTWINIQIEPKQNGFKIISTIKAKDTTGVEMEALTAVSAAALTIYDMCKAVDKKMLIKEIYLIEKTGLQSSNFKTG